MNVESFYKTLRLRVDATLEERMESPEREFPSEEIVFSELISEMMIDAGISNHIEICHWTGILGSENLRITGYSLNDECSDLELIITHYCGSSSISNVNDKEAVATVNQAMRFLSEALGNKLEAKIDPSHSIRSLITRIRSAWPVVDRVKIVLITNARVRHRYFSEQEIHQKIIAVEVIDIERIYQHMEGKSRDDLAHFFDPPVACVHVPDPDAQYEYALTALPGAAIQKLYARFGTRLMDSNVRTYLGGKRSVNRGITKTLCEEPEHFLAYNNGLVLVCDSIQIVKTTQGNHGISFLGGIQIVNGGQTASSIYFSYREDRSIDLSHVLIPAKIIILKKSEDKSEQISEQTLIGNITRFANSQNVVKLSDLSANRPFHVQLEQLSESLYCPDEVSRWYYERASGSYNLMLLREGTSKAALRKIREVIHPSRKLTKIDIARYHEAWRCKPEQVALAGEKNFAAFMRALDEDPSIVPNPLNEKWYRRMIATAILFRSLEKMIRSKEAKATFGQGWVNITTYVVSLLSDQLGDRLDLDLIWDNQCISAEFRTCLWDWAVVVNERFNALAPGQQFSEVAKRKETWQDIRTVRLPKLSKMIPEVLHG